MKPVAKDFLMSTQERRNEEMHASNGAMTSQSNGAEFPPAARYFPMTDGVGPSGLPMTKNQRREQRRREREKWLRMSAGGR